MRGIPRLRSRSGEVDGTPARDERNKGYPFIQHATFTIQHSTFRLRNPGNPPRPLRHLPIPATSGLSFGHIEQNLVLPIGARATLDADGPTLRVEEPAVT